VKLLLIIVLSIQFAFANTCSDLYSKIDEINTIQLGLRTSQSQELDAPANETMQDLLNDRERILHARKFLVNDYMTAREELPKCLGDRVQTEDSVYQCLESSIDDFAIKANLVSSSCKNNLNKNKCIQALEKYNQIDMAKGFGKQRLKQIEFARGLMAKKDEFQELHKLKKHLAARYALECKDELKHDEIVREYFCDRDLEIHADEEVIGMAQDSLKVSLQLMLQEARMEEKDVEKACDELRNAKLNYKEKFKVEDALLPSLCAKCDGNKVENRKGICVQPCRFGLSRENKEPYKACVKDPILVEKEKAKETQPKTKKNRGLKIALISVAAGIAAVGTYYAIKHFSRKRNTGPYSDSDNTEVYDPTNRATWTHDDWEGYWANLYLEQSRENYGFNPNLIDPNAPIGTSTNPYLVPPFYYGMGISNQSYFSGFGYAPYMGNQWSSSFGSSWLLAPSSTPFGTSNYSF
jgi:hypothetical protein